MPCWRTPIEWSAFLMVALACTTVHRPLEEPVTQDSLALAIEAIRTSQAPVEILEDGLQATVYHYEWRELEPLTTAPSYDGFSSYPLSGSASSMRMLAGPRESVHLPYDWIEAVVARSWPLWAGVEIRVAGVPGERLLGPLVIRAEDAQDAARLADAIDCLRRARKLANASPLGNVSAGGESAGTAAH